ncbi:MAG: hypothetical protein ACQES2_00800 [Pseudomonadota bacterium]
MIHHETKRELFDLLTRACQDKVPVEKLFYQAAKNSAGDAKEVATQAALLVKKGHSMAVAGMEVGLFTPLESRALYRAVEQNRLGAAFFGFSNYYEIRKKNLTHLGYLWPYGLAFMVAIMLAPMPDLMFSNISSLQYIGIVIVPIALVIALAWALEHPRKVFGSKLSMSLALPKRILLLPAIGPRHARSEMSTFLEYCGILRNCGYSWREAVSEAATQLINPTIQQSLHVIPMRMQRRDPFADAVKACEYFPEEFIDLLHKADQANRLEEALIRFKASDLLKGQAAIKKHCKKPVRLLLIGTGLLILYTIFRYWMLVS